MYLFIWPPKVFQRLDKNDKNVLIESPTAVLDTERGRHTKMRVLPPAVKLIVCNCLCEYKLLNYIKCLRKIAAIYKNRKEWQLLFEGYV